MRKCQRQQRAVVEIDQNSKFSNLAQNPLLGAEVGTITSLFSVIGFCTEDGGVFVASSNTGDVVAIGAVIGSGGLTDSFFGSAGAGSVLTGTTTGIGAGSGIGTIC